MSELRVLSYIANDDGERLWTIAMPAAQNPQFITHPLMNFGGNPEFCYAPIALNVADLKKQLRAMLAACDKPAIHLQPERLIPAILKEAADAE